MSTIKSSNEHLTFNADGSAKEIRFQANGTQKASISSAGAFTSTTIDATVLTGNLPALNGAALTGVAPTKSTVEALGIDVPAANLTGTIADARFPATLPAISAANLTAIPAANITGTLPAISGANLTGLSSFDPDGAVVFNESGADVDFRVEGSGESNALVVDGANGGVGIGSGAGFSNMNTKDRLNINSDIDPGTTPAALSIECGGVGGGTNTNQYGLLVRANGYNNASNMYGVYSYTPTQYTAMPYGGYFEGGTAVSGYGVYGKSVSTNLASGGAAYGVYGTVTAAESSSATGVSYGGYFTNQGTSTTDSAIAGLGAHSTNGSPFIAKCGSSTVFEINGDGRGLSVFTAKAWVRYRTNLTNPLIRASHNVSSLTDNGVGNTNINFTNNLADSNYAISVSGITQYSHNGMNYNVTGQTTSTYQIIYHENTVARDGEFRSIVFGN